jgi:methionine-gamma-lyase
LIPAFRLTSKTAPEDPHYEALGAAKLALAVMLGKRHPALMKKAMAKSGKATRIGDSTIAIHVGEDRFGVGAAVGTPISRTANFTFANTEEMKRWAEGKSAAYIYTRYGNPTLAVAEQKIAALEGAEAAVVTASGSAAISSALLGVLRAGDEVIATRQLYGGSYRLMRDVFPRFGIVVRHVESDLAGIERLVNPRTKAVYVETPTNPTLRLVDLQKVMEFVQEWDLVSIIDNTFATPVLQKPIGLGFHLVVHSATKYLAGHSDVIAGAVAGSKALIQKVRQNVIYLGGSMDPEAAFLLIRGLKTLGVRMERQCKNAMLVAKFLEKHPKVARVHYPGLLPHPEHHLAKRQMRGFGAMLAFDMKGGLPAARRFCDRVRIFLLAASLGGVESLVVLPIYTSHYKLSEAELRGAGVEPGTVRVSVGLEEPEDLIEDLRQALA